MVITVTLLGGGLLPPLSFNTLLLKERAIDKAKGLSH